jgi:hypothetical protein
MRPTRTSKLFAVLLGGAFLLSAAAGVARAEGATKAVPLPHDPAVSVRLRFTPPLGSVIFVGDKASVGVGLGSASLGIEIRQLLAFEAGAAAIFHDIHGPDPDYFLRLGVVRTARDWRKADGTGWMAQVDLLGGFRQITRSGSPDGHDGSEVTTGATGHVGLEWSDRRPDGTALLLRVIGGATVPLTQTTTGYWGGSYFGSFGEFTFAVDLGFNLGIAF